MAIYVVSDLHGQYRTFLKGLRVIEFTDGDQLFMLGDAIDRGPDGIAILRHVMHAKNMDLIIGNHELMMLNSVDPEGMDECTGEDAELWIYYNGGNITFDQYAQLSLNERKELLNWLRGRYVIKTVQPEGKSVKFCLTHSNYEPAFENKILQDMDYEEASNIVWMSIFRSGRTWIPDVYGMYEQYIFVTGHVPIQRAFGIGLGEVEKRGWDSIRKGNLLDIDGGCAMGAYREDVDNGAIFLRLDDEKIFTVPIIGKV